jgi:hypothetical protein
MESLSAGINISDYGTPAFGTQISTSESTSGDGSKEITAYANQQVRYFQIFPPDYHGIGSRVEWTATYHVVWKGGKSETGCVGLRAINPGKIVDDDC